MRSALTMLLLIFAAPLAGRGEIVSAWATEGAAFDKPVLAGAITLSVAEAKVLTPPLARRWETAEQAWRPEWADGENESPLTRNDVRSAELFFSPALASAMSLMEQTPILKRAGAWSSSAPWRFAAKSQRVRGRQSDP